MLAAESSATTAAATANQRSNLPVAGATSSSSEGASANSAAGNWAVWGTGTLCTFVALSETIDAGTGGVDPGTGAFTKGTVAFGGATAASLGATGAGTDWMATVAFGNADSSETIVSGDGVGAIGLGAEGALAIFGGAREGSPPDDAPAGTGGGAIDLSGTVLGAESPPDAIEGGVIDTGRTGAGGAGCIGAVTGRDDVNLGGAGGAEPRGVGGFGTGGRGTEDTGLGKGLAS